MKVLDLQCVQSHTFEGWFASEDDFVSQCARGLVLCPLCGDASVQKKLSAPHLKLSTNRRDNRASPAQALPGQPIVTAGPVASAQPVATADVDPSLTALWMELAQRIVASTQDMGDSFAEEARRMHYGETEERAIRGQASVDEARALVEEGIDILPVFLPHSLKKVLQ